MNSSRRQATRQRLYDAAVTLIAEQGFSATTVEQIAERAGVAKGTVYYNFAGKTELFEELLRHGVGLLTATLRDASRCAQREATARGGPPAALETLDALVRAGLEFGAARPAFTRLYVAEVWRSNRAWRDTLAAVRGEAVGVVEEVLWSAVRSGELEPGTDVPLMAPALLGMVLVTALDWLAFQPERGVEEVQRAIREVLRGGLAVPAPG
jgi:AcrR family transcriptional regulator